MYIFSNRYCVHQILCEGQQDGQATRNSKKCKIFGLYAVLCILLSSLAFGRPQQDTALAHKWVGVKLRPYTMASAWTGGWWGARSSSPLGSILTLCFWKFEVHVQIVFTFHYGLEMFKLSINWIEIKMLCKFWSLTLFPLMHNGHLYVKATQGTDVCSGWYTTKPWRYC